MYVQKFLNNSEAINCNACIIFHHYFKTKLNKKVNMSDTPLAKMFVAFNNVLDSKVGTSLGLRKWVEKITYQGTYQGANLAKKSSRLFPKSNKQSSAQRLGDVKKSDFFESENKSASIEIFAAISPKIFLRNPKMPHFLLTAFRYA